jgi:hypothetical protein
MSLARTRIILVILAALAIAVFGVSRLIGSLATAAEASQVGSLDGLTTQVTKAGWVDMDHDMSGNAPGYQMPPAMMPGMPEQGKERIALTITVTNTSDRTRPLVPREEFALHAASAGDLVPPHSRLAPHNAVTGVLFFDVPPGDADHSDMWLEWSHDGTSAKVSVPLEGAGAGPDHQHNP